MGYLFLLALLLLGSAPTLGAQQMIKATPSRTQLYWGKPFTIDLTITPPERVAELEVVPDWPPGFKITPPKKSMPSALGAGSSYTVVYEITPPTQGFATTEKYRIVFNVGYRHATASSGEPLIWQSVEVPFTGTFSREKFLVWAVVGLLVGWFIKALGSEVMTSPTDTALKERKGVHILLALLSRRELASALTSIAMGFLAVLLLSRHELPTGAIHDTLALGIGLGFLGDDQLLSRIKAVGAGR
jgi:hypothetical protein